MFKLFPWKWIKRIYLEDNPILVNFDNWIYFQIFRKSCTRSSFWEVSSPWRYICCREKERNVSIQWIFFSEVCFRIWCYLKLFVIIPTWSSSFCFSRALVIHVYSAPPGYSCQRRGFFVIITRLIVWLY